ncbi:MAG: hypothetical protein AAFR31_18265, partial [Cyanobacteria bacterium J06627_8]
KTPKDVVPPTASRGWQQEDDVTRAAKSLAQMFNGAIVNLDEESDSDSDNESESIKPGSAPEPSTRQDNDTNPETLPGSVPADLSALPTPSPRRPINLDDVPF